MAITLKEKTWKSSRPKSAEGSGVAKALKLTDKDCAKAPKVMSLAEVVAGLAAADALSTALKTAQGKMAGDKSKEAGKIVPLMVGWMKECTDFTYDLRVRKVGLRFAEMFAESKVTVDEHHAQARSAHQLMLGNGGMPENKRILTWMGTARDVG